MKKHLALLREQYVKLQSRYEELSKRYAIASVSSSDPATDASPSTDFVGKILEFIAGLYNSSSYRYNSLNTLMA